MSRALYAVINPVVKFILSSPVHGLMSHNTLVLDFKGRSSGKTYSTAVSYHISNGHVHYFTEKSNQWWRNLQHVDEIERMSQPQASVWPSSRSIFGTQLCRRNDPTTRASTSRSPRRRVTMRRISGAEGGGEGK